MVSSERSCGEWAALTFGGMVGLVLMTDSEYSFGASGVLVPYSILVVLAGSTVRGDWLGWVADVGGMRDSGWTGL
jgi:hypothetical protein